MTERYAVYLTERQISQLIELLYMGQPPINHTEWSALYDYLTRIQNKISRERDVPAGKIWKQANPKPGWNTG